MSAAVSEVGINSSSMALGTTLFHSLGVDGVYARTARYERVIEALGSLISQQREPDAEILRFPPVMSRHLIEKSGYLKSFPNLLGCVCTLQGNERQIRAAADLHEHGGDWTQGLAPGDLVLAPAACYPVYPLVAERGAVPPGGLVFDVAADCFRHEPSRELDRLQSFRMREFVRIGTPSEVNAFRAQWLERGQQLAASLELPAHIDVASDPFFGKLGQVMAVSQLQHSLKFELLIPYRPEATPTACMSFNCHLEHFTEVWKLQHERGEPVHTGCVAFGLDRLAVALFSIHGVELERWPVSVRRTLSLQ